MNVGELYAALEKRIPKELSCSWDNDGLMCCPNPNAEAKRVLVVLDITEAMVEKAIREGYDVILSHHPLLFRPIKALDPANPVAKKLIRLISAGVTAISFHTRLDAVAGGVNDTLASALGLSSLSPFGADGEEIGRVGRLDRAMTLREFAALVKSVTGAPYVMVSDAGRSVERVAVLGGSGSGDVAAAAAAGADTYLSGELSHHHLTDAPENQINLLAAGHYYTEQPVCGTLMTFLQEIDGSLEVTIAESNEISAL